MRPPRSVWLHDGALTYSNYVSGHKIKGWTRYDLYRPKRKARKGRKAAK